MKRLVMAAIASLLMVSGLMVGFGDTHEAEAAPWHKTISVSGRAWCGPKIGFTAPCSTLTLKAGSYSSKTSASWGNAGFKFYNVPKNTNATLTYEAAWYKCEYKFNTSDPWLGDTSVGSLTCRK